LTSDADAPPICSLVIWYSVCFFVINLPYFVGLNLHMVLNGNYIFILFGNVVSTLFFINFCLLTRVMVWPSTFFLCMFVRVSILLFS
jgi:hypothetical protein